MIRLKKEPNYPFICLFDTSGSSFRYTEHEILATLSIGTKWNVGCPSVEFLKLVLFLALTLTIHLRFFAIQARFRYIYFMNLLQFNSYFAYFFCNCNENIYCNLSHRDCLQRGKTTQYRIDFFFKCTKLHISLKIIVYLCIFPAYIVKMQTKGKKKKQDKKRKEKKKHRKKIKKHSRVNFPFPSFLLQRGKRKRRRISAKWNVATECWSPSFVRRYQKLDYVI